MRESALKRDVLLLYRRMGIRAIGNALDYRQFHAGLDVGSPDIVCILPPLALFVAVELKIGRRKQSRHQIRWQKTHEELGGFYYVVRSESDAILAMQDASAKMWDRINLHSKKERRERRRLGQWKPGNTAQSEIPMVLAGIWEKPKKPMKVEATGRQCDAGNVQHLAAQIRALPAASAYDRPSRARPRKSGS